MLLLLFCNGVGYFRDRALQARVRRHSCWGTPRRNCPQCMISVLSISPLTLTAALESHTRTSPHRIEDTLAPPPRSILQQRRTA